jgi:hypothetical protein
MNLRRLKKRIELTLALFDDEVHQRYPKKCKPSLLHCWKLADEVLDAMEE